MKEKPVLQAIYSVHLVLKSRNGASTAGGFLFSQTIS